MLNPLTAPGGCSICERLSIKTLALVRMCRKRSLWAGRHLARQPPPSAVRRCEWMGERGVSCEELWTVQKLEKASPLTIFIAFLLSAEACQRSKIVLIFRGFLIKSHLSSVKGTVYMLFSENCQTGRFPGKSSGKLTKAINVDEREGRRDPPSW